MVIPPDLLIAGICSFFIGIISAILGLGGGFLLVPMYTLFFGLDPVLAIGTSLTTSVFTASSASICHAREKTIEYQVVMMLIVGSLPSVIIASYATSYLPKYLLTVFFSLFLICIALQMMVSGFFTGRVLSNVMPYISSSPDERTCNRYLERHRLIFWGIIGGFVSGFSGISAGTLYVPALFRSGFSMKSAVAASLAAIVVISSGGAIMSILLDHVSFPFLIFSAGGITGGAIIGARLSYVLRSETIQYAFGGVLMIIAIMMLNTVL